MSREILFRGKRIDNGEWVEGYYANCLYPHNFSSNTKHFIIEYPSEYHEVYTATICQYTGLTDKNGKKIFEGDIFKFNDEVWESSYTACGTEYDSWEVDNYGVVGYDNETARYDFCKYKYGENSVEADLHENHDLEFADFIQELKVGGNIFDNPELLEV